MKQLYGRKSGKPNKAAATLATEFEEAIYSVMTKALKAGFHSRDIELLAYRAVNWAGYLLDVDVCDAEREDTCSG